MVINTLQFQIAGNMPFEVKVIRCEIPTEGRLLRRLDTNFIKGLKLRMHSDPVAPGTPPLALHYRDISKKEDFLKHLAGQYTYEVLGGMHTIAARKELLEEEPGAYVCSPDMHIDSHTYTVHTYVKYTYST